jgi:Abnormal spindle-like microcephaly-assoc'd, ASPM-SPD-2-Hydin
MNGLLGGKSIALALLLLSISGMFGCGATSSAGGTQPQQNLALGTASLNFGTVVAGADSTLSDTIANNSSSTVTISSASASNSSFKISSPALPVTLAPGQSTNLMVAFSPQTPGKPTGTITLSTAAEQLRIAVSGTAVNAGTLAMSPSALSFGNVMVGKSQTQSISLTNSGGSAVTVTQASASSSSFSISGLTLPLTLNPSQSATFTVLFTPKSAGNVSGSIAVTGNASLSAQTNTGQSMSVSATASMSGDGVAAGQLNFTQPFIDFGDIAVGKSQTQTATLLNSGSTSVTISQASASGPGFSLSGLSLPATLAAGQSVSFPVTFTPKANGTVSGNVAVTSNASNPSINFPLSGVGVVAGALTANPTSLAFGTVQVGSSRSLSETLTNSGGSTISVSQASISGSGLTISGLPLPTKLTAGQSITFNVKFAPNTAGAISGTLSLTSTAPNPNLAISVSATGAASGQLAVSPSTLSFGNVTVGASKSLTSTLTASGSSVTISSATSNSSEFKLSGLSLPVTLNAGQSATFTVLFAPQASGSTSASLSFASNASNAPPSIAASGSGVAATQHSVSLSWQASTSPVMGYNVYRGTQSGGPYAMLNSSVVPSTDYTDSSVAAGQTYFYVLTSVDSQGLESVQSSQVKAVIPTP